MCYRGEITGTPVVGRGSGGQGAHLRICGPLRHAEQFTGLVLPHREPLQTHKRTMHDGFSKIIQTGSAGARAWRCLSILSAGRQHVHRSRSTLLTDFDSTPPTI